MTAHQGKQSIKESTTFAYLKEMTTELFLDRTDWKKVIAYTQTNKLETSFVSETFWKLFRCVSNLIDINWYKIKSADTS